ncbi:MAG: hypothetical protein ABI557_17125, partial [Aureliella sp.]
VVEENLRPDGSVTGQPDLWFVVLPNSLRGSLVRRFANVTGQSGERSPFLMTRMLTLAIFAGIGGWLCFVVWKMPERLLEACFLCLAWFWLLAPTQNPWYWTWALCLVPFARTQLWQAVGGLTLLYYWRFWFLYHPTPAGNLGTDYQGVEFFDFGVTWLEFGPFLFVLLFCGLKRCLTYKKQRNLRKKLVSPVS